MPQVHNTCFSEQLNVNMEIIRFVLFIFASTKLFFSFVSALPLDDFDTIDVSHLGSEIYGKPSENTGKSVEEWTEEMEVNPEELGEYLEGDILMPSDGKNGLLGETSKWKDGVVPYEISWLFASADVEKIERAMDQYHRYMHQVPVHFFIIDHIYLRIGCTSSLPTYRLNSL